MNNEILKKWVSSMLVYIKGEFTLLGEWRVKPSDKPFRFTVPLNEAESAIVEIYANEKKVLSLYQLEISKELEDALQSGILDGKNFDKKIQDEITSIESIGSNAVRKVLYMIKYHLYQIDAGSILFSVKNYYWSKNKEKWMSFPMIISASISINKIIPLDNETSESIQEYVINNFQPLIALRHLQKAKKESIPRYKWIDATIAAELAIKEFLIRLKPDIETLLLEVPSPPLHKLYGSILESFIGERSPVLKEITKGVEIRNKLIHRPEDTHIDRQDADNYVQWIEIAIYHLLSRLYPEDPIVKHFYPPHALVTEDGSKELGEFF